MLSSLYDFPSFSRRGGGSSNVTSRRVRSKGVSGACDGFLKRMFVTGCHSVACLCRPSIRRAA